MNVITDKRRSRGPTSAIGTRTDPAGRRRQGDGPRRTTAPTSPCPACSAARCCAARTRTRASSRSTQRRREALPGVKAVVTATDFTDLPLEFMPVGEVMLELQRHGAQRHGAREGAVRRPRGRRGRRDQRRRSPREALRADQGRLRGAAARHRRRRGDAARRADPARRHVTDGVEPSPTSRPTSPSASSSSWATSRRASPRPTSSSSASSGPRRSTRATSSRTPALASCRQDGQADVWCCTQGHSSCAPLRARCSASTSRKIRVIADRDRRRLRRQDHRLPRAASRCCCRGRSGRPVKMVMTREEVFRATGPTSGADVRGQDRRQEGRHASSPPQASSSTRPAPSRARRCGAGACAPSRPTTSRTCGSIGYDVVVNRPKVAAYRAPGAPIAAFAVECVIDEIAEQLGMDPIELRLKNAAKRGHQGRLRPEVRPDRP